VTWREIEVELVAGDEALLKRVGRILLEAGAAPSTSASKVARALQRPGSDSGPDISLGGLIRAYVTDQVDALLQRDIDLRREQDVAHPTRVAIRRLRSVLHVLADVFDTERATTLNAELSWYAGLLGEVRDREVLRDHLRDAVAALPAEVVVGPVAERIEATLTAELGVAKLAVAKAMKSPRYFALVRELKAWRDDPAFLDAHEPIGGVGARLRAAAAKAAARVRAAEKLNPADPEAAESVHRARKAAKRARYIAELARPRLGSKAKAVIAEATAMQDRLGGHQDSIVAAQFLLRVQRAADAAVGESPFTYGILWAQEQQKAAAAGFSLV
jgi:CHAD domain-containing protein